MPKFKFLARAAVALFMAHGMGKCSLALAQVSEIKGSVITSHKAPKNFVRNGEFEQNELGVTDASSIVTRTTSAPLSGKASSAINATSSGQIARYEILAFGDAYPKGGDCEVSFLYTGDASLYKAYVRESGTRISLEKQLSNRSASTFSETINYVCGTGANAQELVIESTGDGAAIKVDSIYAGGATNIGSVSQAHVIVRARGIPTGPLDETAPIVWGTENLDLYGWYNNSTGQLTAGAAGSYCWDATLRVAGTESSDNYITIVPYIGSAMQTAGVGLVRLYNTGVTDDQVQSSGCLPLVSGDVLSFRAFTNIASPSIQSSDYGQQLVVTFFPERSAVVATTVDSTMTASTSYTPTGSWTNNTTYSGVWWRIGDKFYSRFRVSTTGAPNSTSLTVNYLASGLSIDTSKLVSTATNGSVYMGSCKVFDSGTFYMHASIYYNGSNVAVVGMGSSSASNHLDQNFNDTFPMTWTNGDAVECETVGVPIQGWTVPTTITPLYRGSVTSRDNTAGVTTVSTTTSVSSSSTLTDQYDTVLGNPSGGSFTSTLPPAASMKGRIYNLIRANYTGTNTWTIDPNSTETVCGQSTYVVARTLSIVSDGSNWHGIGPECNLPVIVQATSTASTVYNNGPTTFTVASENIDSHNAWTSNTFTAPRAGAYMFCGTATVTGIIAASNQWIRLLVRNITGGTTTTVGAVTSGDVATINSQTWTVSGCHVMQMTLGGTADFQIQTNTAGSQTQVSTNGLNNIFIVYLGPSTGVQ